MEAGKESSSCKWGKGLEVNRDRKERKIVRGLDSRMAVPGWQVDAERTEGR